MGKWVVLATAFAVSGCAMMHQKHQMDASLEAYKGCLTQNPKDADKACESARLRYEADAEHCRNMGWCSGNAQNINVHLDK